MKRFSTLILLLSLSICSVASRYNLPDLGSASGGVMGQVQEEALGQRFIQAVRQYLPLVQDPASIEYVQTLGYRLASNSSRPARDFHFFVVNDGNINAFAGPGGFIGVNSGLILAAKSEGEVAAVMAHEIAHVTQRHIARGIAKQKNMQLANIAALLGAIALGGTNPQAAGALATGTMAGSIQHGINFTRQHEEEADRVGMGILARSGYSPKNMAEFFKRLDAQSKLNASSEALPQILFTHPFSSARQAEAENRAKFFKVRHLRKANVEFPLIQARLLALGSTDHTRLVRELKSKLKPKHPGLYYAYALALFKTHQFTQSLNVINTLVKQYPHEVLFKMTKANLLQAQNQSKAAIHLIKTTYQKNPNDYALLINYAHILMQNKRYKTALDILEQTGDRHAAKAIYLSMLSKAQGKSGQLAKAYQTRAKLYLLNYNKPAALLQLQQGLKFAKSPYTKARIEREIRLLKQEIDEQS